MSTPRFPNLKEIYRQQVEVDRDDYKSHLVTAVCTLILCGMYAGYTTIVEKPLIIAEPELVGVIAFAAVIAIVVIQYLSKSAARRFDRDWDQRFEGANTNEGQLRYFAELEAELSQRSVAYSRVIVTKSYIIFPFDLASFIPIGSIQTIQIREYPKYQGYHDVDLFPAYMIYVMEILLQDGSRRTISRDEDEIRELMLEIRQRHPDVGFTKQAHAYFFPTSVQVE